MNAKAPAFSGPNQGRYSRRMSDLEAQLRQAQRDLKLERERNKVLRDENERLRGQVEALEGVICS